MKTVARKGLVSAQQMESAFVNEGRRIIVSPPRERGTFGVSLMFKSGAPEKSWGEFSLPEHQTREKGRSMECAFP